MWDQYELRGERWKETVKEARAEEGKGVGEFRVEEMTEETTGRKKRWRRNIWKIKGRLERKGKERRLEIKEERTN